MRLLLDTHVWLWWVGEPQRLRPQTLDAISARTSDVYLSVASVQEIVVKHALGRLSLPEPPESFIPSRLGRDRIHPLPVELAHALEVAMLPSHHRDPFDRLLVAQARKEGLTLVTADPLVSLYPVSLQPA